MSWPRKESPSMWLMRIRGGRRFAAWRPWSPRGFGKAGVTGVVAIEWRIAIWMSQRTESVRRPGVAPQGRRCRARAGSRTARPDEEQQVALDGKAERAARFAHFPHADEADFWRPHPEVAEAVGDVIVAEFGEEPGEAHRLWFHGSQSRQNNPFPVDRAAKKSFREAVRQVLELDYTSRATG